MLWQRTSLMMCEKDDLEKVKFEASPAELVTKGLNSSLKPQVRDESSAREHEKAELSKGLYTWQIGPMPAKKTRARKASQRFQSEDPRTASSAPRNSKLAVPSQALIQRTISSPGRTLNSSGIQALPINDQTYPLLQAAREWSVQANMLKNRAMNESLGDSWWKEQLQSAVRNPFLMHALLATGGSFAAVKTKSKDQRAVLFHNVQSISLLRQQLITHKSTLSTLQTLMLLTAFEFYLGNSRAATAHVRAAGQIVSDLGGFREVPWASKTFLISALIAISTKLKELPILPVEDWDEGPLESQPWLSPQLEYNLAVASIAGTIWSQTTISTSDAAVPCCSWREWLSPTKEMFSLLEYVQHQDHHTQSNTARIMQWIHNRRFVIKARLLEEYIKLIHHPEDALSRGGGVHRTLEACACLATTFCQSLIMFDVPQLLLIHEPRLQLRSLISEVYKSALSCGSEHDHEILLWVAFIGAASEITLNPKIVEGNTSHDNMWFSSTFLECVQALAKSREDLPAVFGKFIWHEQKFAAHLNPLLVLAESNCVMDVP